MISASRTHSSLTACAWSVCKRSRSERDGSLPSFNHSSTRQRNLITSKSRRSSSDLVFRNGFVADLSTVAAPVLFFFVFDVDITMPGWLRFVGLIADMSLSASKPSQCPRNAIIWLRVRGWWVDGMRVLFMGRSEDKWLVIDLTRRFNLGVTMNERKLEYNTKQRISVNWI